MTKLILKHTHNVNDQIQQFEFEYEQSFQFDAGQYLELIIEGEENLYFTIASSPKEKRLILLIENKTAGLIKTHCLENGFIKTKPPMGECHINNFSNEFENLILVASGSGFSQMRSICQDVILNNKNIKVTFIWGSSDFFEQDLIKTWESKIDVQLYKIENEQNKHQDLLNHSIKSIPNDLANSAVIACGSPDLVYPLLDSLIEKGLDKKMMLADVFQFMPRQ